MNGKSITREKARNGDKTNITCNKVQHMFASKLYFMHIKSSMQ